ncbi:hypothetical protein FB567DRAFT_543928 [Paraphoma chrysanthemicola]|uniref:Uncharacterized protein n=1 Tax=Paraphoma chrysanthemicola TaxID=798071 RepID=A0A8K0RLN6_9PLEO|nr:hypothetical protein FB567DRAFT_543928 [Paraphoma chrysanthemicola]
MGKFRTSLIDFIENIPDSKLEGGFPSITKTIYKDDNYRLDMQTVNHEALFTSIRRAGRAEKRGPSVGKVLVPVKAPYSAAEIRARLLQTALEHGDRTGLY